MYKVHESNVEAVVLGVFWFGVDGPVRVCCHSRPYLREGRDGESSAEVDAVGGRVSGVGIVAAGGRGSPWGVFRPQIDDRIFSSLILMM